MRRSATTCATISHWRAMWRMHSLRMAGTFSMAGEWRSAKGKLRLQPFAHALVGAAHIYPRAAFGNNGFAARLGGGAETRLKNQLWLRIEADYVRSQLYSSGQSNFQAVASINYRFLASSVCS